MYGKPLAHVEVIRKVEPIAGADKIELATVLDWTVVIKKGEFREGDLAVYVEIGSILPNGLNDKDTYQWNNLDQCISALKKISERKNPPPNQLAADLDIKSQESIDEKIQAWTAEQDAIVARSRYPYFEFLRPRKFKIKTMTLNKFGVISQGILFSLDTLGVPDDLRKPGTDLTERYCIIEPVEDADEAGIATSDSRPWIIRKIDKYMMRYAWYREYKKNRNAYGRWLPEFPGKSDEENAQKIYSSLLNRYADDEWVATEKLEGQNISLCTMQSRSLLARLRHRLFGKEAKRLYVSSRALVQPDKGGNKFWGTVKRLGLDKKVLGIEGEWFIRGEHVGPGIQKNIYALPDTDVIIFDVYARNPETGVFDIKLGFEETREFCARNDLKFVPVIDEHARLLPTAQDMVKMARGKTVFGLNRKHEREGLVLRLRKDYNVSFKAKSDTYSI